jgi:ankyrin repeat protein
VRRHLEEGKIDVNIKDMSGDTALHIAATKGWRQIVTLLVLYSLQSQHFERKISASTWSSAIHDSSGNLLPFI